MSVVFFGSSEFACPALKEVSSTIRLVVSQPARPSGRGLVAKATPVARLARELGLELATPARCRSEDFIQMVSDLAPDLFVVASYGQILPKRLLDIPKFGAVNLHASILPKYRGAAPIARAIEAGETETGVTLMMMDVGLDTGDVVAVDATPIGPEETAGSLHDRLSHQAARLLAGWLPVLLSGSPPRVPQDSSQASYAKKVERSETFLDFHNDAMREFNRWRAFHPKPGMRFATAKGGVTVSLLRPIVGDIGASGTVVSTRPELVVACSSGALSLLQVQPDGRKVMNGSDFANGARIVSGQNLSDSSPN